MAAAMGKPLKQIKDKKKKPSKHEDEDLPELDDAVDAFGRQQERIGLELSDHEQDEDSLDEEGVYDLDDDDEDEEDLEDEALERGGEIAKLAKTAKALRQKLKLHQGADDDDQEEEEDRTKTDRLWGASKRTYYGADTLPDDDDEEVLQEEEEEALRLGREHDAGMRPEDFGLEDDEDDEDDDGDETLEQTAKKAQRPGVGPRPTAPGVEVEVVDKSLAALSSEEQLGAIMADAPELLALLKDLQESLSEVRHRVAPVLKELTEGGLGTAEGVSYLEAKHLLLLSYCQNIIFYLLLKSEGRPVKDHPVIGRLVQLRAFLEKIRPIDKQLAYQIQKILRAASVAQAAEGAEGTAGAEEDDAARYGPQPDALLSKASADGGANGVGGDGVYRPPRLNPVAMDEDLDGGRLNRKEERRLQEAKRKASRSDMMRELAQEIVGAPEELRETVAGMDSLAALRTRHRMEARSAVEEDLMMRVQLSKQENKRLKAQRRAGLSGHGMLEDFADDVADLVGASRDAEAGPSGRQSGLSDLFNKHKVSQKFGADAGRPGEKRFKSGDEDAPRREALHERRAKFDQAAARKAAKASALGDEGPAKRHREEDEFYQAAKAAGQAKKKVRSEERAVPRMAPALPDEEARGARRITNEIDKNRGMTPHKRRDLKNPRKKHRVKYAEAVVRRKGQVQTGKTASAAYGGEATGIKSKLSTSRRMG